MIRIAIVKHFNLGNVKNLVSFFLKKFCLLNKNSTKNAVCIDVASPNTGASLKVYYFDQMLESL